MHNTTILNAVTEMPFLTLAAIDRTHRAFFFSLHALKFALSHSVNKFILFVHFEFIFRVYRFAACIRRCAQWAITINCFAVMNQLFNELFLLSSPRTVYLRLFFYVSFCFCIIASPVYLFTGYSPILFVFVVFVDVHYCERRT